MSVELGPTVASAKAVPGAENGKDQGKVKASDDTDASAGGGFSGLLALAAVAITDAPTADPALASAGQLAQPDAQQVPTPPVLGLATAVPENVPNDLAMMLAQAVATNSRPAVAASAARNDPSASQPPRPLGRLQASAPVLNSPLSVQPLPMDLKAPPGELGPDSAPALLAPAGAGGPGSSAAVGNNPSGRSVTTAPERLKGTHLTSLLSAPSKAELSVASAASQLDDAAGNSSQNVDAASLLPLKTRTAELQSGVSANLAESRKLEVAAPLGVSAREPTLANAWVTSALAEGLPRQPDRFAAKSSVFSTDAGMGGIWGQSALHSGNRFDAPLVMAPSTTSSLETSVAETVSYWATQGVQNAELKLDGLGDHPVAVHISMKGDQAHIDFRTDQPEVRQLLEGASTHLKELLKSEGLVLSGVSVGTSAQGNSQAPDQRPPAFARQSSLTSAPAVVQQSLQRVNPARAGAVDLFV